MTEIKTTRNLSDQDIETLCKLIDACGTDSNDFLSLVCITMIALKENEFSRSICVDGHHFDVSIKKVEDA